MSSTKNRLHRAFGIDVAAHGDLTGTKLDPNVNLEVIGVGLSRTGTTSLQAALTSLGFAPSHQGVDLFRSIERTNDFIDVYSKVLSGVWKAGDPALTNCIRQLMRGYRSSTDIPIYPLVEEVYAAYPNAKYILTTRPGGANEWYKSMDVASWHWRRDWWRTWFRFCVYPVYFLRRTDDKVQVISEVWRRKYGTVGPEVYDGHKADVKKLIPSKQLLVYDVREGWEPLCKFLEVPIPREPYPNLNDSQAMKAIYFGQMAFGLFHWALYASALAGVGYLAVYPDVARNLLDLASHWASQMAHMVGLT